MGNDLGDEPIRVLEARTEALEMIVMRLVVQWASDWEEPRRAGHRLVADLVAEAGGSESDMVTEQLHRFGETLDERLSHEADPL